jgi:hypothetical protein
MVQATLARRAEGSAGEEAGDSCARSGDPDPALTWFATAARAEGDATARGLVFGAVAGIGMWIVVIAALLIAV